MIRSLVIIESPFMGKGETDEQKLYNQEQNIAYARRCVRECVTEHGEAPIASHLLFTQEGILRDSAPSERDMGIEAGLAWRFVADFTVFYVDRGWSHGMRQALALCKKEKRPYKIRSFDNLNMQEPPLHDLMES